MYQKQKKLSQHLLLTVNISSNDLLVGSSREKPRKLAEISIHCHSLSFVATRCTTRFHSLSFVVTRCTTRYHSLSLDVSLVSLFINDCSD